MLHTLHLQVHQYHSQKMIALHYLSTLLDKKDKKDKQVKMVAAEAAVLKDRRELLVLQEVQDLLFNRTNWT